MRETVVDASAVAAILFDEPEAAPIAASVRGNLLAPTLLRYELASVATTRLIRHPHQARAIQQRYDLLDELRLAYVEPEWPALPALARRWSLSAYDAAYLQLALSRSAVLVTLDARLAAAWDDAAASGRV
jgi:Predicted nucleic acid-binding protein, contains PIN domain